MSARFLPIILFAVLFTVLSVPTIASADPVCVRLEQANLRKGPGMKYPVTWTVNRHMPLDRIGRKGSWYQVRDVDGATHWVAASTVTSQVSCVVIKTKRAPLREGPGVKHPYTGLAFADRYTPYKKIDRDGAWIQLQDDYNHKFWVYENHVWFPVIRAQVSF